MSKKISIIMPTYNDGPSIFKALESALEQDYDNLEIIIVDDGSTDQTKQIIQKFKKEHDKNDKIQYFYQRNSDQLNAIKRGLKEATGEFVFIFHSDDVLPSNNTLSTFAREFEKDKKLDSVIGNLIIINDNDEVVSKVETPTFKSGSSSMVKLLALFGSNFYSDVALHKKSTFETEVKKNYLDWNTVFWINFFKNPPQTLNVKKIHQPILKYRVGSTNYNTDKIGRHNVLNGELRTVTNLLCTFSIPNFKMTNRFFSLLTRNKKLFIRTPIIYFKKETKKKSEFLDYMIRKRYANDYSDNIWLTSLVKFYKNKQHRSITLPDVKESEVFLGSDLRAFTKQLFAGQLPKIYYRLFDEMQCGFDEIIINNDDQLERYQNISRFLCIYPDIKITIKKEQK